MHRHISESHHRKFYRERLRYATHVDYWNSVQKENVLNDMIPLAPWGDFNAQDGWAGYVPCKDYLVVIFLKLAESSMAFMRRSMQMLDAQIIAGDASLKVPKFIRLSGGAQAKKFLYTAMNGYGQVVGLWFVDQDSMEHLQPYFDAMQQRFECHGVPSPVLAYGDNCCGKDRTMFCASFPGLRHNAEAERQAEAANAKAHRSLRSASLCNLGCESKPRVVSSRESADAIAAQLDCNPQVTVIGMDAEWTQGAHSRVDVLSLCVPNFGVDGKARVFLFRLCKICQHEKQLPPNLLKLLQNDSKTFTGNRVQGCVT